MFSSSIIMSVIKSKLLNYSSGWGHPVFKSFSHTPPQKYINQSKCSPGWASVENLSFQWGIIKTKNDYRQHEDHFKDTAQTSSHSVMIPVVAQCCCSLLSLATVTSSDEQTPARKIGEQEISMDKQTKMRCQRLNSPLAVVGLSFSSWIMQICLGQFKYTVAVCDQPQIRPHPLRAGVKFVWKPDLVAPTCCMLFGHNHILSKQVRYYIYVTGFSKSVFI